MEREERVLITRANADHAAAVRGQFPDAVHHESARCIAVEAKRLAKRPGTIAVLCAGTSDLPVADEAALTADFMGNDVVRVNDVGVAGLHRLLASMPTVREASVVIAVAGMEGALPSVVAGLVHRPVIAVPTSVGYGASFGGSRGAAGHAQQLRQRRDRGEHRQRLRRRLRRQPNQLPGQRLSRSLALLAALGYFFWALTWFCFFSTLRAARLGRAWPSAV